MTCNIEKGLGLGVEGRPQGKSLSELGHIWYVNRGTIPHSPYMTKESFRELHEVQKSWTELWFGDFPFVK